jgi:hypothetical protein
VLYSGQCHCGKLKASFVTQKTPQALGVRTCQCDFCRRHGAVNISDPDGEVTLDCAPGDLERYRFALRTADFLLCKTCGVYIAAAIGEGEKIVSTINVAGLRMNDFLGVDEAPMEYGAKRPKSASPAALKNGRRRALPIPSLRLPTLGRTSHGDKIGDISILLTPALHPEEQKILHVLREARISGAPSG